MFGKSASFLQVTFLSETEAKRAMNIMPDYYKKFCCIADKCRHSCCIGWEIDIDEDSLERYKQVGGELGKRLRENISDRHFALIGERCPFLKNNGLCELICAFGEDSLCDICREHPRFYNEFENRTEAGLGLCCEAASRLILSNEGVVRLVDESGREYNSDDDFYAFRNYIFSVIQNRSAAVDERISELFDLFDINISRSSMPEWAEFFESLEVLDKKWLSVLEKVKRCDFFVLKSSKRWQIAYEQLLVYFVYRHLTNEREKIKQEILFAVLALYIICACCGSSDNIDDFYEAARMFSSEIEYCEENTAVVFEKLK